MRLYFRYSIYAILLACLGLLLAACAMLNPTARPTLTHAPSQTATLTQTPTLTPSPTPQPPTAVLLASSGADQAQVSLLQTSLNDIIVRSGLRWQVRQQLTPNDLVPAVHLVVVVPPDPGIAELAASAPDTQFLAVGISGLQSAPNLTTISSAEHPDQQGFMAGMLAAMLSNDWRVGVITRSDTVEGKAARTGFHNGVVYFCGLCRPAHPPFYEYPLSVELPATATTAEWQEAANYMVDHNAETVYVYPGAGDEAMLAILAAGEINIISSGAPPQAARSSWVVSLDTDALPFIQAQVQGLLDGSLPGGRSLSVPIQFSEINPTLFTPGKQRLAEQVLSDLQSGFIDTGVDLSTGELRP